MTSPANGKYDAIVLAVAHKQFREMGIEQIRRFGRRDCILYDIKSILPKDQIDGRLESGVGILPAITENPFNRRYPQIIPIVVDRSVG